MDKKRMALKKGDLKRTDGSPLGQIISRGFYGEVLFAALTTNPEGGTKCVGVDVGGCTTRLAEKKGIQVKFA